MAGPAPVLCGQTRAFGPSVQGGAPGRIWASSAAPPGCVPASGRSAQAGHVAIPCGVLYVSVLRPWIRPPVLRAGTVHLPQVWIFELQVVGEHAKDIRWVFGPP